MVAVLYRELRGYRRAAAEGDLRRLDRWGTGWLRHLHPDRLLRGVQYREHVRPAERPQGRQRVPDEPGSRAAPTKYPQHHPCHPAPAPRPQLGRDAEQAQGRRRGGRSAHLPGHVLDGIRDRPPGRHLRDGQDRSADNPGRSTSQRPPSSPSPGRWEARSTRSRLRSRKGDRAGIRLPGGVPGSGAGPASGRRRGAGARPLRPSQRPQAKRRPQGGDRRRCHGSAERRSGDHSWPA